MRKGETQVLLARELIHCILLCVLRIINPVVEKVCKYAGLKGEPLRGIVEIEQGIDPEKVISCREHHVEGVGSCGARRFGILLQDGRIFNGNRFAGPSNG